MNYEVKLTLLRDQLGTNPLDPRVMDTHIQDRQRKLIAANSKVNKAINKYLDALPIDDDKAKLEIDLVIAKLEEMIGHPFEPQDRLSLASGTLQDLKETFEELDIKGTTVFFKDPKSGMPMISDHMIYGFMKAASEAIGRTTSRKMGTIFGSISFTQSIINQHVRIPTEFITFDRDIERNEKKEPVYLQRSLRGMTPQGPRISLVKSEFVPKGSVLKFDLKVFDGSPLEEQHLHRIFAYGEFTGLGQWRNSGKGSFGYEMIKKK